jgi:hypothetical protein
VARAAVRLGPRVLVLTHFGTPMLEADPHAVARALGAELGLRVLAAHDGLALQLDAL